MFKTRLAFSLVLLFSLATGIAKGQATEWMKQQDPDSLGLFVSVSDGCPFTSAEVQEAAEGEYLRARLRATTSTSLNITIDVNCLESKNKKGNPLGHFVHYGIRFGTRHSKGAYVLYESPNYGSMLMGDGGYEGGQFFVKAIRDDVAKAITDYLKANFN